MGCVSHCGGQLEEGGLQTAMERAVKKWASNVKLASFDAP